MIWFDDSPGKFTWSCGACPQCQQLLWWFLRRSQDRGDSSVWKRQFCIDAHFENFVPMHILTKTLHLEHQPVSIKDGFCDHLPRRVLLTLHQKVLILVKEYSSLSKSVHLCQKVFLFVKKFSSSSKSLRLDVTPRISPPVPWRSACTRSRQLWPSPRSGCIGPSHCWAGTHTQKQALTLQ